MLDEIEAGFEKIASDPKELAAYRAESDEIEAGFAAPIPEWEPLGSINFGARLSMFAYYDPDADIAWFPAGESDDVVSERTADGLRDYDRTSRQLVAIEVWDASTRLPPSILQALPAPGVSNGGTPC